MHNTDRYQQTTDGISTASDAILAKPSSTQMQIFYYSAMDLLSVTTAPTAAAHVGTRLKIWLSSREIRRFAQTVSSAGIARGRLKT
jgi:hypothetical protein